MKKEFELQRFDLKLDTILISVFIKPHGIEMCMRICVFRSDGVGKVQVMLDRIHINNICK